MSGLILPFGLWYLIMTVWFINALTEPGDFKEIISELGLAIFVAWSVLFAVAWWTFLLDKGLRDAVFEELGAE